MKSNNSMKGSFLTRDKDILRELFMEASAMDVGYSSFDQDFFQSYDEDSDTKSNKRKSLMVAIAVVILLIIIAIPLYLFVFKTDRGDNLAQASPTGKLTLEKKSKEPVVVKAVEQRQEKTEESSTSAKNVNSEKQAKDNEPVVSSVQQATELSASFSTNEDKLYSLILGSFKVESNADNFERQLNDKGIDVSKFQRDNDFYFVGIEQIKGKSSAIKLLATLREEEEPTAWIIKKM